MGAKAKGCDSAARAQGNRLKPIGRGVVPSFREESGFVVGGDMCDVVVSFQIFPT